MENEKQSARPMVVQSLIFDKEVFPTADAAKKWAKDHDFRADKVDPTENSFRLRQRDPADFDQNSFRTKALTRGVKAVLGKLKEGKSVESGDLLEEGLEVETEIVVDPEPLVRSVAAAQWHTKDPGLYAGDDRFSLTLKELSEDGEFTGYASVFNKQDLTDEIVMPGAFARTLKQRKTFPLLWQHDRDLPIGMVIEAEEDGKGLKIKGKLALAVSKAKDTYELIRAKVVNGLSIGYRIIKDEWERDTGVRRLKEVDLWEISTVLFPACPWARISAVKSAVPYQSLPLAPEGRAWDAAAAVKRVRAWSGSGEEPSSKYRRAFLWFNEDAADSFGSYKLPYADVIDGALTAVPRGIFAAAAVIQGARGGAKIPEGDVARIKAHLARYYKRMDRDAPWEGQSSFGEALRHILEMSEHADEEALKPLLALALRKSNPSEKPFDWMQKMRAGPEAEAANLSRLLDTINVLKP